MKSTWYKKYDYGKTENLKKKALRRSANDRDEFQMRSPQGLINKYVHTNSRNDR